MAGKTYGALRTFVQDKLDLRDEDFVDEAELLSYTEEAIRFCEAEVHKLNIEDQYFTTQAALRMQAGRSDISLPSNIYANKILRVVYSNGTVTHDLKRIRSLHRYASSESTRKFGQAVQGEYSYMLVNNSQASGTRIRLFPTPTESSTYTVYSESAPETGVGEDTFGPVDNPADWVVGHFLNSALFPPGTRISAVNGSEITVTNGAVAAGTLGNGSLVSDLLQVWYIREAEVPTLDEDEIDFPEFWTFIAQHVVVNCLKKEPGNPRLLPEVEALKELKEQMLSTLSNMVPDQDDTIEPDMTHYMDMGEY